MKISSSYHGVLAQLMARERLTVIKDFKAETASIDVENRIIRLPIWQTDGDIISSILEHEYSNTERSEIMSNLFIGHEVSHALWTPSISFKKHIKKLVPPIEEKYHDFLFSIINIVEDARIERLCKERYPGMGYIFIHGYRLLWAGDFFFGGSYDKYTKLKDFKFLDRINLHFKRGPQALIPFVDAIEDSFVTEITKLTTFDEVMDVSVRIFEHVKKEEEENANGANDCVGEEVEGNQQIEFGYVPKFFMPGSPHGQTSKNIEANQRGLVGLSHYDHTYYALPTTIPEGMIVPYPTIFQNCSASFKGHDNKTYRDFLGKMKPVVAAMVNEFNRYKAATDYEKTKYSKTGILNMKKLSEYQFSDDIFRRFAVTPKGKNHGLVMFVDWSGSMSSNLHSTLKQIFTLISFCTMVKIDFEIYAFVRPLSGGGARGPSEPNGIVYTGKLKLLQLFSSTMSRATLDQMMSFMFRAGHDSDYRSSAGIRLAGDTPLYLALSVSHLLVKKMQKKCELVHMVVLSDGEDTMSFTKDGIISVIYDPITKFETPSIGNKNIDSFPSINFYAELVKMLRKVTNANYLGFFLTTDHEFENDYKELTQKQCGTENFAILPGANGYNEFYLVKKSIMEEIQNLVYSADDDLEETKRLFEKRFDNINNQRIFLTSFVRQIVGKSKNRLKLK